MVLVAQGYDQSVGLPPRVDVEPRCWNCHRQLAWLLARPWDVVCPRCDARCTSPDTARLVALVCDLCHGALGVVQWSLSPRQGPLCASCGHTLSPACQRAIDAIIREGQLIQRSPARPGSLAAWLGW